MTEEAIYKRTDKGLAELDSETGTLPVELKRLLRVIGRETTFGELQTKLPQVPYAKLRNALDELTSSGHLEVSAAPEAPGPAVTASGPDLDIARSLARPVKEPSIQQRRQAEQQTIAGLGTLKQAGYFVNILSRPPKRIPPRSGDKYSVLIIDADERNTLVAARTLLLAGFDTHVAVKRDEIVTELNRRPPADVIAMDVMLPDVIGLELLGRLREHPVFKTVPIIVMTAKAEHEDVVAALAYGASSYMTKPFKPEALLDSVEAVLGLE